MATARNGYFKRLVSELRTTSPKLIDQGWFYGAVAGSYFGVQVGAVSGPAGAATCAIIGGVAGAVGGAAVGAAVALPFSAITALAKSDKASRSPSSEFTRQHNQVQRVEALKSGNRNVERTSYEQTRSAIEDKVRDTSMERDFLP